MFAIGVWIFATGTAMADPSDCVSNQATPQAVISGCGELLSRDLSSSDRSVVYTQRAKAYLSLDKIEEAAGDLELAITLNPTNAEGYIYRGQILTYKKEYDPAKADFDRAIDISPDIPITFQYRAQLAAMRLHYPQAAGDYEQAAKLADARRGDARWGSEETLAKYAESMRQNSQHMLDTHAFEHHWVEYLRYVQEINDHPNWLGPPYDLYLKNHPEFLENNPDAEPPPTSAPEEPTSSLEPPASTQTPPPEHGFRWVLSSVTLLAGFCVFAFWRRRNRSKEGPTPATPDWRITLAVVVVLVVVVALAVYEASEDRMVSGDRMAVRVVTDGSHSATKICRVFFHDEANLNAKSAKGCLLVGALVLPIGDDTCYVSDGLQKTVCIAHISAVVPSGTRDAWMSAQFLMPSIRTRSEFLEQIAGSEDLGYCRAVCP